MKNLRRTISVLLLSLSVLNLTPGIAFAQGKEAITTDAINFRDSGSIQSNVLGVIPMGKTLEVLETTEKWALVEFENKTGWVSLNYIVYAEDVKATKGITNIQESIVRKEASSKSEVLETLKAGSMATLIAIENGWFKISYNTTTGYVYAPEWIPAPVAPVPTVTRLAAPVAGKMDIFSDITIYMSAADALARRNAVGTYAAGEYLIYKNYSGMINITKHENVPGAWINPAENKDNSPVVTVPVTTTAKTTATTTPRTTTATQTTVTQAPTVETYKVVTALSTYTNAWDAKDRINSVGQYSVGTYYIYRNYGGMLNLTKNKGVAGAWINPAQNVGATAPTTPVTTPSTTTTTKPPATTTATTTTKPNPDTIIAKATVNMRKEPSNLSTILRTLPAGAKAVMIGKESNWVKIEYQDQIGYTYITYWDIPTTTLNKFTVPVATTPAPTKPAPSTTTPAPTTTTPAPASTTPSTTAVVTTTTPLPKYNPSADGKFIVYLDPGHMGVGKGAVSTVTGEKVDENTINYRVAVFTKEILELRGYTVYISKDSIDDAVGLEARATEANALNADIFVSIHCNSFSNPTASGTIGFWAGEKLNPAVSDWQIQSKTLSQLLAQRVGTVIGKSSAPSDVSYGSSFYVNRNSAMPSTLLELGFISNFQDATILNTEMSQQEIAVQIAQGIDTFFGR